MKHLNPGAWMLAWMCWLMPLARADASLVWETNRLEAVEAARNSGKLILLLAGRDTCGNCSYMKDTVCEAATVRQVIDANYVCWFCPVDTSTEWYSYASGLGSFTLPLMCVIEPGAPTGYLDRTTATQSLSVFEGRLRFHLPAHAIAVEPLRATPPRLRWSTESPLQYRVLKSEDLVHWELVGALVPGTGSPVEYEDPNPRARSFYRVMGFR